MLTRDFVTGMCRKLVRLKSRPDSQAILARQTSTKSSENEVGFVALSGCAVKSGPRTTSLAQQKCKGFESRVI
jgi:hypothetical protein